MSQQHDPDPDRDRELDEVARLLDEAAAQEALERSEADALRAAPGLDRVEATLSEAWGAVERSARKRARIGWLGVLAAAAAVVLFFLLRGGEEPRRDGPRGEYLSDGSFEVVEPPARAARWDRIRWTGPEQGTYRVRISDLVTGKLIYGPHVVNARTEMPLSPEDTVQWPRKIVIDVEMRRADGSWTSAEARVSELQP